MNVDMNSGDGSDEPDLVELALMIRNSSEIHAIVSAHRDEAFGMFKADAPASRMIALRIENLSAMQSALSSSPSTLPSSLPSILQDLLYKCEEEAMQLVEIVTTHHHEALEIFKGDGSASRMIALRTQNISAMKSAMAFSPTLPSALQDLLINTEEEAQDLFQKENLLDSNNSPVMVIEDFGRIDFGDDPIIAYEKKYGNLDNHPTIAVEQENDDIKREDLSPHCNKSPSISSESDDSFDSIANFLDPPTSQNNETIQLLQNDLLTLLMSNPAMIHSLSANLGPCTICDDPNHPTLRCRMLTEENLKGGMRRRLEELKKELEAQHDEPSTRSDKYPRNALETDVGRSNQYDISASRLEGTLPPTEPSAIPAEILARIDGALERRHIVDSGSVPLPLSAPYDALGRRHSDDAHITHQFPSASSTVPKNSSKSLKCAPSAKSSPSASREPVETTYAKRAPATDGSLLDFNNSTQNDNGTSSFASDILSSIFSKSKPIVASDSMPLPLSAPYGALGRQHSDDAHITHQYHSASSTVPRISSESLNISKSTPITSGDPIETTNAKRSPETDGSLLDFDRSNQDDISAYSFATPSEILSSIYGLLGGGHSDATNIIPDPPTAPVTVPRIPSESLNIAPSSKFTVSSSREPTTKKNAKRNSKKKKASFSTAAAFTTGINSQGGTSRSAPKNPEEALNIDPYAIHEVSKSREPTEEKKEEMIPETENQNDISQSRVEETRPPTESSAIPPAISALIDALSPFYSITERRHSVASTSAPHPASASNGALGRRHSDDAHITTRPPSATTTVPKKSSKSLKIAPSAKSSPSTSREPAETDAKRPPATDGSLLNFNDSTQSDNSTSSFASDILSSIYGLPDQGRSDATNIIPSPPSASSTVPRISSDLLNNAPPSKSRVSTPRESTKKKNAKRHPRKNRASFPPPATMAAIIISQGSTSQSKRRISSESGESTKKEIVKIYPPPAKIQRGDKSHPITDGVLTAIESGVINSKICSSEDDAGKTMSETKREARLKNGLKGIDYKTSSGIFHGKIYHKARIHRLGEYELACDAALAYDEAARLLYGSDSTLNFTSKKDYLKMRALEMKTRGVSVDLKETLAAMASPIEEIIAAEGQRSQITPHPPSVSSTVPRSSSESVTIAPTSTGESAERNNKTRNPKNKPLSSSGNNRRSSNDSGQSTDRLMNLVQELSQPKPTAPDPSVGSDFGTISSRKSKAPTSTGESDEKNSSMRNPQNKRLSSSGISRRSSNGSGESADRLTNLVQETSQSKHTASDPVGSDFGTTRSRKSKHSSNSRRRSSHGSSGNWGPDAMGGHGGPPSTTQGSSNAISQLSGSSSNIMYGSSQSMAVSANNQSKSNRSGSMVSNGKPPGSQGSTGRSENLAIHQGSANNPYQMIPRDLDLPSDSSFEPSTIRSLDDDGAIIPKVHLAWSNESQSAAMTGRSQFSTTVAQPHNERDGSKVIDGRLWASFAWILTFPVPNKCIQRPTKAAKQAWREKVALFVIMLACSVFFVGVLGFVPLLLCKEDVIFSQKDIWVQAGESWIVVHGVIYDIKDFIYKHPGGVEGISDFLGKDASKLFPRAPPATLSQKCLDTEKVKTYNLTEYTPENSFMNPTCPSFTELDTLLGIKCHTFAAGSNGTVKYLGEYERGLLSHTTITLDKDEIQWFSLYGRVYDVTDYIKVVNENRQWFNGEQETDLYGNPAAYLTPTLNKVIMNSLGRDATNLYETLFGSLEYIACLETMFYTGLLDDEFDVFCYTINVMMYCMLVFVSTLMLLQFIASMIYICPRHRTYSDEDVTSPVMIKVPCYCEGDNELRKTIKSVFNTSYPDENKVLVMVADGLVTGDGEEMSTPEHLANLLGFDIDEFEDDTFEYIGIGVLHTKNRARVYHGILQKGHKFLKYIVVIKCGLPGEETTSSKPGNRGKRDSQLIMIGFMNRIHYGRELTELDCALQRAMMDLNLQVDMIRFLMAIDADTRVDTMSITHMVYGMNKKEKVIALCGETKVDNKASSWVTMIQVFEYYSSHHLKKAFEAAFGCVTCLPGCFTMYRIIDDDGTPLLPGDGVMYEYSRNDIETLHEKNLYHLGEDRLLTTLLLQYYPDRTLTFIPEAVCWTIVPHTFKILLSQRRRWINSTVHNMFELLRVKTLCGVGCVNMKIVVCIDLVATMILPASYIYSMFLFFLVFFDDLPVSTVLLILYAIMMGCQVAVFILRSRWEYMWWFFIYLTVGLPVFYLILPIYAFWNMDDFSWGKTRAVGGISAANAAQDEKEADEDGKGYVSLDTDDTSVPSEVQDDMHSSTICSSISGQELHHPRLV